METDNRETKIREMISRVLELEDDIELVEAEFSGSSRSGQLRVYIYKPSGVTIEDCTRISKRLSRDIEHEENLQESLSIEVSSPGLDRILHTRRDFERVIGEILKLKIEDEKGQHSVLGRLMEVEAESLLLDPPPKGTKAAAKIEKEPKRIPLSSVTEGSIEVLM